MKRIIEKADVLIEALPYIQKFRGEMILVKFGGSTMEDKRHYNSILTDITFMECIGMIPIIVHGGGKAISKRMKDAGIHPNFVKGLRVTDEPTIKIVEDVIRNEVNPEIVRTLNAQGAKAERVDGQQIFSCSRKTAKDPETGAMLDWGYVGEIEAVNVAPIMDCIADQKIPVVTPLGRGTDGHTYNLNADDAAASLARALPARKLAFLTDVPGLLRDKNDESSVLSTLHIKEVEDLIRKGIIDGGMLPKIHNCVEALKAGVSKIHIIDGRLPHSLLLEIFTDKGVGTEIVQ